MWLDGQGDSNGTFRRAKLSEEPKIRPVCTSDFQLGISSRKLKRALDNNHNMNAHKACKGSGKIFNWNSDVQTGRILVVPASLHV